MVTFFENAITETCLHALESLNNYSFMDDFYCESASRNLARRLSGLD